MHTIYLVRHAHSPYTPDEWGRPLSENGFEDAKRVADFLDTVYVDRFISSPYKRAIQTIEEAARRKKSYPLRPKMHLRRGCWRQRLCLILNQQSTRFGKMRRLLIQEESQIKPQEKELLMDFGRF